MGSLLHLMHTSAFLSSFRSVPTKAILSRGIRSLRPSNAQVHLGIPSYAPARGTSASATDFDSGETTDTMSQRVLGRGCDPNMMSNARAMFSNALGVPVDGATDDEAVMELAKANKYDVFFLAPGLMQLCRMKQYDDDKLRAMISELQPGIKFVEIWDPTQAVSQLKEALDSCDKK